MVENEKKKLFIINDDFFLRILENELFIVVIWLPFISVVFSVFKQTLRHRLYFQRLSKMLVNN